MISSDEELNEIKHRRLAEMIQHKSGSDDGSGKPVVLTDATFERTVASSPVTVVDFWAAWCGPCRMVAPIIDQLAKEYAGRVTFGKLNVDENPAVSNAFQIQSIPSLLTNLAIILLTRFPVRRMGKMSLKLYDRANPLYPSLVRGLFVRAL